MPTPIKRIEKDFLIKALFDEQIPVIYIKGRTQYVLTVENPTKGNMFFRSDRIIAGASAKKNLNLMFDFHGQIILFTVKIIGVNNVHLITSEPEYLYRNLDRSFSRVSIPHDLRMQFSFLGDRYSLFYPKVTEYENVDERDLIQSALDPRDLNGLIDQIGGWIKSFASDYKLVIFKDVQPSTTEERVIAEMGKSLFIPSTSGAFPQEDPTPKKRIITETIFKQYLESIGMDIELIHKLCERFIEKKREDGIISDLWSPILFQEYVIGYIHLWIDSDKLVPFDYWVIDEIYPFAKILANSLKLNGFFESGKVKNDFHEGKTMDISASGMLFAYPRSPFAAMLMPESELSIQLKAARRTINTRAKIVRCYRDNTQAYFGCRFMNMEPEDIRFLFEYIYGKTLTDEYAVFLSGKV